MPSKQSKAEGMKRTNPGRRSILAYKHRPDPFFHFPGSLVGESNRQDVVGAHSLLNKVRDTAGDDASLPRPSPGND
jgi:hypothetical protein